MKQRSKLSPFQISRKLLLMVAELHRMGYQRLRIVPGMAPSGCYWRCKIVPASMISPNHGAKSDCHNDMAARYSSGQEDNFFGWNDVVGNTPTEMAQKFIERFPKIAEAGCGGDDKYVSWYLEMLRLTEPDGIIFTTADSDWPIPEDKIPVANMHEVFVPLPPLP